MVVGKKQLKALRHGTKKNLASLLVLVGVIAEVGSSLTRKPKRVFIPPAKLLPNVGKATYFVKVKEPVSFPTLEFTRKKDAECLVRTLQKSKTLMGMKVDADILRQEVTGEGYHL